MTSSSDATSPSAATPSPSASASSADASPSATTQTQGNDALLAAAALAAKEISDGTVVSVEAERNGWEVHVVTADGDEQQLRTDPAGESIVSGPTDDRPDADDRTENEQLAGVKVDVGEAVKAVEGEVDGGQINELSLDLDNRSIVWEADVRTGSEQRSVQIDADNGDVISNRIDD
ncbi:hypothetical protein GCM10022204_11640 [Microlunatus aurantiacus]|uniref:Peptidase propeptide and YPEB domain-containing protein n=1 Tax=Microlunatus aurantiacus TaxID=446786 RepID=A0ABP7D111_9ACTN